MRLSSDWVAIKEELDNGTAVLLDVREKEELSNGMLKRAQHFPLSDISKGILPSFEKEMVYYIHCASGVRSQRVADLFSEIGLVAYSLSETFDELSQVGL